MTEQQTAMSEFDIEEQNLREHSMAPELAIPEEKQA